MVTGTSEPTVGCGFLSPAQNNPEEQWKPQESRTGTCHSRPALGPALLEAWFRSTLRSLLCSLTWRRIRSLFVCVSVFQQPGFPQAPGSRETVGPQSGLVLATWCWHAVLTERPRSVQPLHWSLPTLPGGVHSHVSLALVSGSVGAGCILQRRSPRSPASEVVSRRVPIKKVGALGVVVNSLSAEASNLPDCWPCIPRSSEESQKKHSKTPMVLYSLFKLSIGTYIYCRLFLSIKCTLLRVAESLKLLLKVGIEVWK